MPSTTPYSFNDIGMAWAFVLDCEDEDPRSFGVDLLPAYPSRRYGVHTLRHPVEDFAWLEARADVEDAMIAALDEDDDDDTFDDVEGERPAAVCDDDDDDDDAPVPSREEPVVLDGAVDRLPTVIGHRRGRGVRRLDVTAALRDAALAY